jgi:hypothetical protein
MAEANLSDGRIFMFGEFNGIRGKRTLRGLDSHHLAIGRSDDRAIEKQTETPSGDRGGSGDRVI